ncbi:hypothetical protein [Breznakiella homolactica]|uniref:Outer membrane protein beta-barrel domain-containing protein n=1 Tax=Breznakiella homolactica TaxID=2798577 RepID=A0A7T8B9Z9_9SPIR|nr:hypothetical protein [Breznakiella homolactica]QQO08841.1 hypothetical protein JFL75_18215 [Breznakiella homolactica]
MNKTGFYLWIPVLMMVLGLGTAAGDTLETDTLIRRKGPAFELGVYAGLGGGIAVPGKHVIPLAEASAGIQITPWLGIGAFCGINPLSDFEHAKLGISVADTPGAYGFMSGMEIIFMPLAARTVHPFIRAALGGITVGWLSDDDGKEGYDTAHEERFFFASLSAGAEVNLSRHFRLYLRGGYRFAGNSTIMGIGNGGLSGAEAALGLRFLWKAVVD